MSPTRMAAVAATCISLASLGFADGNETLGTPSIPIADGTQAIFKGMGLVDVQPGSINFDVPAGVTIQQAILYWEGFAPTQAGQGDTDIIMVDNGGGAVPLEGDRIGGATFFFANAWASTYRADITGLVHGGANSIAVSGLDFVYRNNGAGIVVIVDDGLNTASFELRDGSDLAFVNFNTPLDKTVPQTFNYAAADFDRPADVQIFVASVTDAPNDVTGRPTIIDIKVFEGAAMVAHHQLPDRLGDTDGKEWDTYSTDADPAFDLILPAGSDSVVVEVISADLMDGNPYEGNLPASLDWLACGFTVPGIPVEEAACRMTGGVTVVDGDRIAHGSGQAGAPTAQQPQPWGEWTHVQRSGPEGVFTFHAGTASAIEGTEIAFISCSDPGFCSPARPAPAKQLDFFGTGSFRNLRMPNEAFATHVVPHESLHHFSVHIEDLGEPGNTASGANSEECPEGGNAGQIAQCDCPDFYRITIHETADPNSPVLYEIHNYALRGNYQIHPEVGQH